MANDTTRRATTRSAPDLAAATGPVAAAVPPVVEQAAAMADAMIATGRPNAAGGAAEDVLGSAREAPGVGSGAVGADVPEQVLAERPTLASRSRFDAADLPVDFTGYLRELVREELARLQPFRTGLGSPAAFPAGAPLNEAEDHDLEITSKVDGFHRGGRAHPARPVPHRSSAFTASQLAAIEREPNLILRRLR